MKGKHPILTGPNFESPFNDRVLNFADPGTGLVLAPKWCWINYPERRENVGTIPLDVCYLCVKTGFDGFEVFVFMFNPRLIIPNNYYSLSLSLSLVKVYITMTNRHVIGGKIHYFHCHFR